MTTPTNKELEIMLESLREKLDEHAKVHEKIINLIEGMRQEMRESNGWKNRFIGGLGVVIVVVLPLLSWALYEVSQIDDRIEESLADFEINIIE